MFVFFGRFIGRLEMRMSININKIKFNLNRLVRIRNVKVFFMNRIKVYKCYFFKNIRLE